MFATSTIEISKSAYKNNIRELRKVIGKETLFSSVVKGNAYGHGIEHIVPIAEEAGVRHFSTFSAAEAYEVCKSINHKSDIMIMGDIEDDELSWAVENGIEITVFTIERLTKLMEFSKLLGKPAKIHIEAETGFHRTGFEYDKIPLLIKILKSNSEYIIFQGLSTHYAGAESVANYLRIQNQIKLYRKFYNTFKRNGLIPNFRHTANSAASLIYSNTIMDMVRIGIAQYGYWPSPETRMFRFRKQPNDNIDLKRLITWKTRVMAVKEVNAGEFIGYGSSYLSNKKMKIAIIPVGYANGFSRSLSNVGRVLIRGRRLPVIGVVTMNTMTVNVSDLTNIDVGEEVVIIGKQRRLSISISSFCEMSEQLNYQLLARLPENIPRIIV